MQRHRLSLRGLLASLVVLGTACTADTGESPVNESAQAIVFSGLPVLPTWAKCPDGNAARRFVVEFSSGGCTKQPAGRFGRWEGRILGSEAGRATCEVSWVRSGSATASSTVEYDLLRVSASTDEQSVYRKKAIIPLCGPAPACGGTVACSPQRPAVAPQIHLDPRAVKRLRDAQLFPIPVVVGNLAPVSSPSAAPSGIVGAVPIGGAGGMGGCGACALTVGDMAYVYLRPEMVTGPDSSITRTLVISYAEHVERYPINAEEQTFSVSLARHFNGWERTAPLPLETVAWVEGPEDPGFEAP